MDHRNSGSVPRHLEALFASGSTGGLTDKQLIQRFTTRDGVPRDADAAFAALVARHGALVWGICRRTAGDLHEAEDAFQATFLILARQAGSLWIDDSLGGWLRRVATRVATRARAEALRRRSHFAPGPAANVIDPRLVAEREDLRTVIADELARLPEKYRAPIELCHLRGLKQDEAARLLDLPVGTVKSRLDRGKRRLRDALTRRGLSAAAASSSLEAQAAVPAALLRATLLAAMDQARGAGALPASVAALVELSGGVAVAFKLQIGLGVVVVGATFAAWGVGVTGRGPSPAPDGPTSRPAVQPAPTPLRPATPDVSGLVTSREEAEGPEPDLGAAILRELRNERR